MQRRKQPEKARKGCVASEIIDGLKGFAEALQNKDLISERFTCRRVVLDLNPTRYSPELVRKTRDLLGASQAIFAQFLGVSTQTVRAWEQGVNMPQDVACRFMDEIRRDPGYWQERFKNAMVVRMKASPARESTEAMSSRHAT